MRLVRHVAHMGGSSGAHRVSARRPDRKRLVGISRRRLEHNIKMYFEEVRWEVMDWIALTQDRNGWRSLVSVVIKFRVL
jgi:hypothetical protein